MNIMLARECNMRVKAGDTVVCVGDFSCRGGERGVPGSNAKGAEWLAKLNGNWVMLEGNHDGNNSVKTVGTYMECVMGHYFVGVQHRPLYDPDFVPSPDPDDEDVPRRKMVLSPRHREALVRHTQYCRAACDFIICGHIHNRWRVKVIAGVWHINVGVDANKYRPLNDHEVLALYDQARRKQP